MALGDFLFPHAEMKLVITRSFETDIESVKDKFSNEYLESAARLGLSKPDFQRLGLSEGKHASVKSKEGTVIAMAYTDEKIPEGIALMPYGPWALSMVAVPEDGSPPILHGIGITVTKTDKDITPLDSLLNS
ncbi:MAG: molybdopterin dinucleotide binding domain-containing protein [Candidatus Thorarchaeota archaeon]